MPRFFVGAVFYVKNGPHTPKKPARSETSLSQPGSCQHILR